MLQPQGYSHRLWFELLLDVKDDPSFLKSCGLQRHVHEPTHGQGYQQRRVNHWRHWPWILLSLWQVNAKSLRIITAHHHGEYRQASPRVERQYPSEKYMPLMSIWYRGYSHATPIWRIRGDIGEWLQPWTEISAIISVHTPFRTEAIVETPNCPWYIDDLHQAKHLTCKLERKWRTSTLTVDNQMYRNQCLIITKFLRE